MNEPMLAEKLNEALRRGLTEVPLNTFIRMFFEKKGSFTDKKLTRKLLDFSSKYKFDYVVVLSRKPVVRFWKKGLEIPENLGSESR